MVGFARKTSGFTLIEVLVTLVVLSVGLLGLAGLQLVGMRGNHSAYLRTRATLAAADLVDRMRLRPQDFAGRTLAAGGADQPDQPLNPAAFDDWLDSLERAGLPPPETGHRGEVNCSNGCGPGNCLVTVRWNDSRAEGDAPENGEDDGARQTLASSMAFSLCTRLARGG